MKKITQVLSISIFQLVSLMLALAPELPIATRKWGDQNVRFAFHTFVYILAVCGLVFTYSFSARKYVFSFLT